MKHVDKAIKNCYSLFLGSTIFLSSCIAEKINMEEHKNHGEHIISKSVIPKGLIDKKDMSIINKRLINFPSRLNGARRIDKYIVSDAKKALVHIRQYHMTGDDDNKTKELIIDVQKNIELVLLDLIEKEDLSEVYVEGSYKEGEEVNNSIKSINKMLIEHGKDRIKFYSENLKKWRNYPVTESSKKHISYLEKELEKTKSSLAETIDDLYYLGGASRKLDLEGKLKVLPGETIESQARVYGPLKTLYDVLEFREDTLLEHIKKRKPGIFYTVYGAAHMFGGKDSCGPTYERRQGESLKDNLKEYNFKNADDKISLIEITPFGVR